jgi:hypothetical protein
MNSPQQPNKSHAHAGRDVPLVIKDGLRELRFSTKKSTKRWMEGVEDALSHIPKVGAPLGAATKTASQLLQLADRAAVDLLSTESPFRRADFRLPPPDFYVNASDAATVSKLFIKNYYWALKHLLKLKGKTDFLVLEESIFQAFRYFQATHFPDGKLLGSAQAHQTKGSDSSVLSASIIHALYVSKPLSHHDSANQEPEALAESTATLTLHACVSVVLASEITSFFPHVSAQVETLEALKLADEVCGARLERWEAAILHTNAIAELALELDFSIRHL